MVRRRTVDEWKRRVDGLDNHWLDCLVGCAVAVDAVLLNNIATTSKNPVFGAADYG